MLTVCCIFLHRGKQETLLAQMQSENKKINETLEDVDLNDMVRDLGQYNEIIQYDIWNI